jgi:outer membrane receptor protein involved in Fe transport
MIKEMRKLYGTLAFLIAFNLAGAQVIDVVNLNTIVITATRTDRNIYEVPQRIEVLSKSNIESFPSLSADNYLLTVPGINVSRSASIFGSGNVSMRGMGNEAGRTLVMIDGVPVNKGDGGSVNWNAISTGDIRQIEVLKGPGSTVHGGNAMGGVINLISKVPTKPLQGYISQSFGTFNTLQSQAYLEGLKNKFFWSVNGSYRNSDGYISTPLDETNEYTVASFLDEYNIGAKGGYLLNNNSRIELSGSYYSGKRGTGTDYTGYNFENDDLASDEGAFNLYEMLNGRASYTGNYKNGQSFKLTLYTQRENYNNIKESLKDTVITRYDVLSVRDDFGFLSGYSFSPVPSHKINMGIDMRYSAVDAADTYVTSTDNVLNAGKMKLAGVYVQDEYTINKTPFSILAGLRYDYASFTDGLFSIENATKETQFLTDFTGELKKAEFSALSPRLSVQYHKPKKIRIYGGYSRGYRAPVLDDMCRTGRISGGMKIANPDLKPEYLSNIEAGTDIFITEKYAVSVSVFSSAGTDYHAYISTGDSIMLNKKLRPVMQKSNIGKIELYGAEVSLKLNPLKNFAWQVSYSYIHTNIIDMGEANNETLNGKELVYQPRDIINTSVTWENKIVNSTVVASYKGDQWINDVNTEKAANYYFIDLRLWRSIYKGLSASLMVQNLLDNKYIDAKYMVAPGRMIFFQLKYQFND